MGAQGSLEGDSSPASADVAAFSVSAFAARLGRAVRSAGGGLVEGEVQRPRTTGGGALVFDLADREARLACRVPPRGLARLGHRPREGELVRCRVARADLWAGSGSLSLLVERVTPTGNGELLRRRRELLARLTADGLCDAARFPPLPRVPDVVGVVASPDSSAWHDVVTGLRERWPRAAVLDACCAVQGARAPAAIVDRLARLQADGRADVVVLARGGGSVRDLVAFDDEALCRALAALRIPVVCAVGHTDDRPVAAHVTHHAHVPREAAVRVVPDRAAILRHLGGQARQLDGAAARGRARLRERGAALAPGTGARRLAGVRERVAAEGRVLDARADAFLRATSAGLDDATRGLSGARRRLGDRRRAVAGLAETLAAADPRRRGWAVVHDADGALVRRREQVVVGDRLRIGLADGGLGVRVEDGA